MKDIIRSITNYWRGEYTAKDFQTYLAYMEWWFSPLFFVCAVAAWALFGWAGVALLTVSFWAFLSN